MAKEKINQREYSLDYLKVVATVLIVFHHYQQNYTGDYTFIKYYGGSFYFGNLVELFFLLSGYFALRSSTNMCFSQYMRKKLKRFLPLLTITAACDQILRGVYRILLNQSYGDGISLWGFRLSALNSQPQNMVLLCNSN